MVAEERCTELDFRHRWGVPALNGVSLLSGAGNMYTTHGAFEIGVLSDLLQPFSRTGWQTSMSA